MFNQNGNREYFYFPEFFLIKTNFNDILIFMLPY